jgi:GNAT superfamily N-acetyltransferase
MAGSPVASGATLRRARATDARAIATVHVASWRAAYPGLLPTAVLDGLSVERRTATWARILADRRQLVEVAEADGGIVGVGHAGPARDADVGPTTGQLTTLYLAPGSWGAGTGRALHDVALARLVEAGYDSAVVWMLSTNDRARRFYVRQGWGRDRVLRVQQFGGRVVIDHRLSRRLGPRTTTSAVPGPTAPGGDGQILSRPSQ